MSHFGKYRQKPVVIEALHYDGSFPLAFLNDLETVRAAGTNSIEIRTPKGTMRAIAGDWIVRGIEGELYPCNPRIFEATYEPVEDDT